MKKSKLAIALFSILAGGTTTSFAVEDMTNILPNAKAGECYAKVLTPAQYRSESTQVVVREASETVKIIPAKYRWEEERILSAESGSQLQVIPASYKTEQVSYEISPASTQWVANSRNSDVPANPGMLQIARAGGADIDSAVPGQCFHEHSNAAKYKTVTERVLVSEASEKIELVDARYEWVEQRVMVSPEVRKLVEVPATYETITEKVLVESAKTVWKKGHGTIERIDDETGDVMCLVEVPAVYKNVSRQVTKTPATTREIVEPAKYETVRVKKLVADAREVRTAVPAVYKNVTKTVMASPAAHVWHPVETQGNFGPKSGNVICLKETPAKMGTISKRVLSTPASVKKVEIPAKYTTKKVRKLVSPASEQRTTIPAVTDTVSKTVKISDARLEWRPILCQVNMTNDNIKRVQSALKAKGYNPGPIDGFMGRGTMSAIERFQRSNDLATGGLTYDTLGKLGLKIES